MGCEGMYRFIMSSGVSGLLDILKTSRFDDIFLGVREFDNISSRVYVFVDHGKGAASWGFKCCELWVLDLCHLCDYRGFCILKIDCLCRW